MNICKRCSGDFDDHKFEKYQKLCKRCDVKVHQLQQTRSLYQIKDDDVLHIVRREDGLWEIALKDRTGDQVALLMNDGTYAFLKSKMQLRYKSFIQSKVKHAAV